MEAEIFHDFNQNHFPFGKAYFRGSVGFRVDRNHWSIGGEGGILLNKPSYKKDLCKNPTDQ